MKSIRLLLLITIISVASCIRIEEEPIINLSPAVTLTAHIKNSKIFATAQVNVNPSIFTAGNIPFYYVYEGDLRIYNAENGTVIDIIAMDGDGLSEVYTVSADTTSRDRFVVIAQGTIEAWADNGDDGEASNDTKISSAVFYGENEWSVSELVNLPTPQAGSVTPQLPEVDQIPPAQVNFNEIQ